MNRPLTPTLLAALGIFLLNVWLNWPLFLPGELPFRGSVEGGYASMARFISAHPDPWGWNPFQYCGLPTQFLYVPALPYLTALAVRIAPAFAQTIAPEYAWRLLTAVAACLGPVTLFFFALYFTGTRRWAIAVAVVYTLFSPSYGLFPQVEKDRGIVQLPWRIQVLAKYGEGPHNTGLTLLPLALLALWRAGRFRGYRRGPYLRILAAAVLLAAIPLTNWLSAFALAMGCLLLLLAAWGEPEFSARRVWAAAALAYLLACFWLTPSFIRTIAFNWPADAFGYHFGRTQLWFAIGLALAVVAVRLVFLRTRGSFYFCFVTLCAITFGWVATVYYLYGIDIIPESRRYALEFELFLILALAEAARLTLLSKNQTMRTCAIGAAGLTLLVGSPQAWAYATQDRARWKPVPRETTVEYRLAHWLAQRHPQGRVFVSGGLRFRLNSWFELAQVGGSFESGLQNRMPLDLAYHIRTGRDLRPGREPRDTFIELRALGVQYVVVHGPKSKEYYRDHLHPEWLAAPPLTPVYHEGGDTVYELPPHPLARLVGPEELPAGDHPTRPAGLERYVAATEDAGRPLLRMRWLDTNGMAIEGQVPPGKLITVQVNAHPGWRAIQDGREIAIDRDNLGFMVLRAAAVAATHIELRYVGTLEQRLMGLVSVLAWTGAVVSLFLPRLLKARGLA